MRIDPDTGEVVAFSQADQSLAESLASQAAIALTNRLLITQLERLFESFVNLINLAIDEKSPYTGGHCQRVPALTMMLAEAADATPRGRWPTFRMSDRDRYELKMAGLLHDCGKITTPVHVVDKATKLQTIYDRIGLVDTRLKCSSATPSWPPCARQLALRPVVDAGAEARAAGACSTRSMRWTPTASSCAAATTGSEAMQPPTSSACATCGQRQWRNPRGADQLSDGRGGGEPHHPLRHADQAERDTINYHIVATIKMLETLPWPRHLKNVPEYAGGHHERMDGKGYPRGLTREQMSLQARMMGIADIFEALTAADRPYKSGMSCRRRWPSWQDARQRPHRPRPVRGVRAGAGVPALRRTVSGGGADGRGGCDGDGVEGFSRRILVAASRFANVFVAGGNPIYPGEHL
jgi:hypothetical protein